MEYSIEQVQLERQDAAVVMGTMPASAIADFLGAAFGEVLEAVQAQGVAPVGPSFAVYDLRDNEVFGIAAGFPVSGPLAPAGRVIGYPLPGGPAVRTTHVGPYEDVARAYHAVEAYLVANGLAPAGPPWESYLDEPGVPEPRTIVTWPVRRA